MTNDADRVLREALTIFEAMNTTEAGVIQLRQHFQTLMTEHLRLRELEAKTPATSKPPDPEWAFELRAIADQLFRLSPAETGLDQAAPDTLATVAAYLDTFGAPANAGDEFPDESTPETRLSVVSGALAGAEERAEGQRFSVMPNANDHADFGIGSDPIASQLPSSGRSRCDEPNLSNPPREES